MAHWLRFPSQISPERSHLSIRTGFFLLPGLTAFFLQRAFSYFPETVETYFSLRLFRWISDPIARIVSFFPFSLTEVLFVLACLLLPPFVVIFSRKVRNHPDYQGFLLRSGVFLGWILSVGYLLFMLFMGFHYARLPLADTLSISGQNHSPEDLRSLVHDIVIHLNEARSDVYEDDSGIMRLQNGAAHTLRNGYAGYQILASRYPAFQMPERRAKGVRLSRLWSYTGISGIYFPFFVEANVNTDIPDAAIPGVVLHELAHTIGIARENDAECAAFLAGIHHPDPDFVYSAWLLAYRHAARALAQTDRDAWNELSALLSDSVKKDLQAIYDYWTAFHGPIQHLSYSVNHAYLRSNMQKDGIQSYGQVVDLLLGLQQATIPPFDVASSKDDDPKKNNP